jgi:hypothetical protein
VSVASGNKGIDGILDSVLQITRDLAFEKSGVVDAATSLSPGSGTRMVPIGDGVARSDFLAPVAGAVVAREVCNFLATLDVAYPRSAID